MTSPVDAIVARLNALHPKRIDLSLDRVQRLLAALDHPERKLPPVVHVAGTNGKGSTIAFLRAILEAAGERVHVYSSPHLVRFNERFRLSSILVSDDELAATLEECERVNAEAPITVFEITTAVGLLLFSRHSLPKTLRVSQYLPFLQEMGLAEGLSHKSRQTLRVSNQA